MKFPRKIVYGLLVISTICTTIVSASASHYYAGMNKSGNYVALSATITTPSQLPAVGSGTSGESCWISVQSQTSSGNLSWAQTGIRYYSGYSGFKTYFEYNYAPTSEYNLREIGTHVLNATIQYELVYNSTSFEWDAYIGGKLLDSYNFGRAYATAQAQGESHNSRSVTLGPFIFDQVKTKSSGSNAYVYNTTTAPTADSPYSVDVLTKYYKFKVYGTP